LFRLQRKPTCPPYCDSCFGYFPNQWRTWPVECTAPGCKVSESAPSAPAAKETQEKVEPPKLEDKKPAPKGESVPAPKEEKSSRRGGRATSDPSPDLEMAPAGSIFAPGNRR